MSQGKGSFNFANLLAKVKRLEQQNQRSHPVNTPATKIPPPIKPKPKSRATPERASATANSPVANANANANKERKTKANANANKERKVKENTARANTARANTARANAARANAARANAARANAARANAARANAARANAARANAIMINNLVAFTYNVCWGCMTSDSTSLHNKTATTLAQYCYNEAQRTHHHVCLENVCNIIEGTAQDLFKHKLRLEIIGLQEATNFALIHEHTKFLKENMLRVSSKQAMEEIVSFYDKNKYKLEAVTCGNLSNRPSDGRPFQILFLQLNSNPLEKIIFINLHRSQKTDVDINMMENIISHSLLLGIITPDVRDYDFYNITPKDDLKGILDTYKNAKIIMLGDFNDQGRNFWNGTFIPFKHTNPRYNLNTIIVKTSTKPPNTCCTGRSSLRQKNTDESLISDYILVSNNINEINSNIIPSNPPFNRNANTTPSSDHLPVLSILEYKLTTTIAHKIVGYDFDGVLHRTMHGYNNTGQGHPMFGLNINGNQKGLIPGFADSYIPNLSIIDEIKKELESGTIVYIISRSPVNKKGFLKKYGLNVLADNYEQYVLKVPRGMNKADLIKKLSITEFTEDSINELKRIHKVLPSVKLYLMNTVDTYTNSTIEPVKEQFYDNIITIQPPTYHLFKIINNKQLRLANNLSDPFDKGRIMINDSEYPFSGTILRNHHNIIFPCGNPTKNGLVYVYCIDNPNIIGYIQYKYLDTSNTPVTIKKDVGTKMLRLLDNLDDPGEVPEIDGMLHSGMIINHEFKLSYPCGEVQPNTGLVIVQNRDDNNVIGYIQNKYLQKISKGGKKKFKKKKR